MARQKGILPLEGTLGNITFFKSREGYLARQKGGVDANKIATSPAFQRTRENNAEFGRAGKAGKLLRESFRILFQTTPSSKLAARITKVMLQVIKADLTSTRGMRNVLDGELELLTGFEASEQSKLGASIFAPYTATIDRASGECTVTIPSFVPNTMIAVPNGATHFKLTAGAAAIDFETNQYEAGTASSNELPLNNQATAVLQLKVTLAANSTKPLLAGLALEFFQEVNGVKYPLKNGSYNAMSIVKVQGT